jgi:putative membrane protein (TIGR04086 family)
MSVQEVHAGPAIRWVRVLLAGFLAEVALVAVAVPLYFTPNAQAALNWGIPPASFVVLIPFGWWAARGAPRSQVLNGFLAGLAGVLLYLCLVVVGSAVAHTDPMASMTPPYLLAHALKLAGGALGGWLAGRKSAAAANPT